MPDIRQEFQARPRVTPCVFNPQSVLASRRAGRRERRNSLVKRLRARPASDWTTAVIDIPKRRQKRIRYLDDQVSSGGQGARRRTGDLATEFEIQPSLIHLWMKQVLDQVEKAFERSKGSKQRKVLDNSERRRIAQLQAKLASKNEVIAELMEENVKAKRANGEL